MRAVADRSTKEDPTGSRGAVRSGVQRPPGGTGASSLPAAGADGPGTQRIFQLQRAADGSPRVRHLERVRGTVQRMPMTVKGYHGEGLDTDDLQGIQKSLLDALALEDDAHIQMVLSELRVKDPEGWAKASGMLETLRSIAPPRRSSRERAVLGYGSWRENPREIERNIHRFWAGGPMKKQTVENLLAMQEVVNRSRRSSTPWTQVVWTSGLVNRKTGMFGSKAENPLDEQLRELARAGVVIRDADELWRDLSVPRVEDVDKSRWDLSRRNRTDVAEKALGWTAEAKKDLEAKKYDKVKWLSDLVRLAAVSEMGGVYMDTDIGPGTLDLRDRRLYHTDPEGEIGHHAPPFRVPKDYEEVLGDAKLGRSQRERVARFGDANIPVLNYFLASRSGTRHLERELAELFARKDLTSGMGMFGRLFVPLDRSMQEKPTPYAPPEQRVTPWVSDLQWTTEVSLGEG